MTLSAEERAIVAQAKRLESRERAARKRERPVSPKRDRGRVREPHYLAWLRLQPCALSAKSLLFPCGGRTDPAHIRTHLPGELPTGLQRKPSDRRCTPLCRTHHDEQHRGNELAFWRKYGLDPFEVAAEHFARFEKERP